MEVGKSLVKKTSSVIRPTDLDETSHHCWASCDFLGCGFKTDQNSYMLEVLLSLFFLNTCSPPFLLFLLEWSLQISWIWLLTEKQKKTELKVIIQIPNGNFKHKEYTPLSCFLSKKKTKLKWKCYVGMIGGKEIQGVDWKQPEVKSAFLPMPSSLFPFPRRKSPSFLLPTHHFVSMNFLKEKG